MSVKIGGISGTERFAHKKDNGIEILNALVQSMLGVPSCSGGFALRNYILTYMIPSNTSSTSIFKTKKKYI